MASDGYIAIHRTTDAAQGELLAEMLRREGIAARFHRVSSALIGLPTSMIEMTVDVPVESEPRARQLIADLEYTGAAESLDRSEGVEPEPVAVERAHVEGGLDGENEDDDDQNGAAAQNASRGPGLSNRRPIFAAAFAVFLPGGAHLYARRAWTGLVLASGAVACLGIAVAAESAAALEVAFAVLVAIVACDAIGGVRGARAEDRGDHASRGGQIAGGLKLLCIAIVLGVGVRVAASVPGIWQARHIEKYRVTCLDQAIAVENPGSEPREVEIANLQLQTLSPLDAQVYDVGIRGPRFVTLAPGGTGVVTPDVADWLARACKFPHVAGPAPTKIADFIIPPAEQLELPAPHPASCRFIFSFAARETDPAAGQTLRAVGICDVPTSPQSAERATLHVVYR